MKRSNQPRRKRKARPCRRKERVAGKGRKPAPMIPLHLFAVEGGEIVSLEIR